MGVQSSNQLLWHADFSGASLPGASLLRANLSGAILNYASLSGAENLTQEQIDHAYQHPNGGPPSLPAGFLWDEDAAKKRWKGWKEREDMRIRAAAASE